MRIWIDLSNSPHVPFFTPLIRELGDEHELLLTCRPLANTIDLLEMSGFQFHVVGRHYGARKVMKAYGYGVRVGQLYRFLRKRAPTVAISQSSYYSPLVARLLGIPCVYLNDNEHALGNHVSFRFADRILVPEFTDLQKMARQGARGDKVVQYPGVKEGIYLWDLVERAGSVPTATRHRPRVYVRPEPWAAHYYRGRTDFVDDLLQGTREWADVVVLPRGEAQAAHYRQPQFVGVTVPEASIALSEIMRDCDLFVGAGGTMTREAAVLGIPTISIYQDELLSVDRFLLDHGHMVHDTHPTAESARSYLERTSKRGPSSDLLEKGRAAYTLIRDTLLDLEHSSEAGSRFERQP
jgi:predicted glycosyltransferase